MDEFQPLGRKVFGILKTYGKILLLRRLTRFIDFRTKQSAMQDLMIICEHVQVNLIEAARESDDPELPRQ
jgi:hypothetical protein